MTEPHPLAVPGERVVRRGDRMSTVRTIVIAVCAAVGVSCYLSLRGAATDEAQPAKATRVQTAHFAASNQAVGRSEEQAPDVRTLNTATEPAFESDASDLTQPSQTLDDVLEALNADIGPEGEYVDPQALAAVIRADPELARLLSE
jgi:hypothetical protein